MLFDWFEIINSRLKIKGNATSISENSRLFENACV